MTVIAADWLPYALPLQHPWLTSQGPIDMRQGSLLRLHTADGRTGWGDAAPLPEVGITDLAAQAFAEETAHLDLLAQLAGLPLHQWLSGESPVDSLAINANLGALPEATPKMLTAAAVAGFSVVKLKVGTQPVADEINKLRQLARSIPPLLKLRLDANRAWSFADASRFIIACTDLPVEGLEEPLAEPDAKALAKLQAGIPFALAIDESTQLLGTDFFRHPPVRRLVIKPARQGGLLASIELALRAKACGLEIIVTSSLESACGLLAGAHLAAAIAPEAAHGLGTAEWFTADTGKPPPIASGRLHLFSIPGLGFTPNSGYRQPPLTQGSADAL